MINILEFIPTGYENRMTRKRLSNITRISDRNLREIISQRRRDALILNLDGGYFKPELPKENHLVIRWHNQETHRAKSIFWSMRAASDYVKELGA